MSRRGREALPGVWEALPKVREGSGSPSEGLGGVGSGWEVLLEVRKGLGGPSGVQEGLGGVEWPFGMSGRGREAPWRYGRPSQWFEWGWEALKKVQEGSGVSPGGPGGVRRYRRGWEALPKVRETSGGSSGGPGEVWRTSRRSRRG